MANRRLLLFDVDGVLVYPGGYKEALRAALDYFAEQMGRPLIGLTNAEIDIFEACGLTNEWDSLAMAVGLLIREAGEGKPLSRPDFEAVACRVKDAHQDSQVLSHTVQDVLSEGAPAELQSRLAILLEDVYSLETLTTRIFQQLTLGSTLFEETYGFPPDFVTESALLAFDTPHLDPDLSARLLDALKGADLGAAIFTARPSLPPPDLPPEALESLDCLRYPPEADLAARLLGFEGLLPLIAGGRLTWLAAQHGRRASDYIKPSPVQALAAIGAALGGGEVESLYAAAALANEGSLSGPLLNLREAATELIVFEDSAGGIRAVKRAADLLRAAGCAVRVQGIGIATEASKQAALEGVADWIAPSINEALEAVLSG